MRIFIGLPMPPSRDFRKLRGKRARMSTLRAESVADRFGRGGGSTAQHFQPASARKRRLRPYRDEAITERQPLAPDIVQDRIVRRGAGIGARDSSVFGEFFSQGRGEQNARCIARKVLVIGGL